MATSSPFQDLRPSSRLSTSAALVLTRIDEPYWSSEGRPARSSNART
jgi:hypothetical protein